MAVSVVSGECFTGVDFGTAPGKGYIIGTTRISELLLVDEEEHAAAMIGVKYYHHQADEESSARPPNELVRMTMLVSQGRWRQRVWSVELNKSVEVLLQEPGDFIAWVPGLWHSWYAVLPSTMLTVSFKRKPA